MPRCDVGKFLCPGIWYLGTVASWSLWIETERCEVTPEAWEELELAGYYD